jgi:DNA-binding LacI/PurR family transcriptional regulator
LGEQVTSHDVARLAGVSQPTVSRALRNIPGTAPETRERVLAAARQLNYTPSESGRTLSTRRTNRVAIVAEGLVNPFYPELVEPVRELLSERGYRTVLITDDTGDSVTVEALADGSYDGVVLCTIGRHSTLPRDLTERGVPHVLVNRVLDVPESSSCSFDNRGGAQMIAHFLARLGHTRIGAIHGLSQYSTGRDRAEGLGVGLRDHGLHARRADIRRVPFTYEAGREAALQLLGRPDRPSALFCGNDVVAIGALSAARELGIRVPDELTIVGFDDVSAAGWSVIGLTTLRCDRRMMAEVSVDLLTRSIVGGRPMQQVIGHGSLILRGTHARLAGRT